MKYEDEKRLENLMNMVDGMSKKIKPDLDEEETALGRQFMKGYINAHLEAGYSFSESVFKFIELGNLINAHRDELITEEQFNNFLLDNLTKNGIQIQ